MIQIFITILGLSVGSFINALVYRLETRRGIVLERSECPACHHTLSWKDLIPVVSFILLKGKCRYCKARILWHYPVVEALSGIAFLSAYLKFGFNPGSFSYIRLAVFFTLLLIIFAYDLRYMLIPDRVSFPSFVIVLVVQLLYVRYSTVTIGNLVLAACLASGFFLIQFLISHGAWIGGGDIRLGFLMGLMLGWKMVLIALFIAYIGGALITLPLVAVKKKTMKSQIPFGVFLTIATIIVLMFGEGIMEWYKGLLF